MGFLSSLRANVTQWAAGAAIVLAVIFLGLWRMADDARADEHAARLEAEDATAKAEAEIDRTRAALEAAETRAENRALQSATQRRDEEVIRNAPETYNCASSPAVRDSLRILRDRRAGDTPASGDTAEPSDVRGVPGDPG